MAEPLSIEKQGSFFIGGQDDEVGHALHRCRPTHRRATITVGQMYVRYQIPAGASHTPVTLIHGCCLTGKTWETTPDGRMGWDEYFVASRAFQPMWSTRWRAAARRPIRRPSTASSSARRRSTRSPPIFTAGHEAAWAIFRFGPRYPKVFDGMQFPLEAQGEFWKQMVSDWNATLSDA